MMRIVVAAFGLLFGALAVPAWADADLAKAKAAYEAAAWSAIRTLAEQGDPIAQLGVGVWYARGIGSVLQDYVQAHKWYNLAASRLPSGKDRDAATKNRDTLAKRMTPTDISEAQRLAREWWAKHGKRYSGDDSADQASPSRSSIRLTAS